MKIIETLISGLEKAQNLAEKEAFLNGFVLGLNAKYPNPNTRKTYYSKCRKALLELGLDSMLDFFIMPQSELESLAKTYESKIQNRTELGEFVYISKQDAESMVNLAIDLIRKSDWRLVCVGLALLTGRRAAEIIATAKFKPVSKKGFWVEFSGQLKAKDDIRIFNIPLLASLDKVNDALNFVQRSVDIQDVEDVNRRFSTVLNDFSRKYFNTNFHDLRKIYGALATAKFKPNSSSKRQFLSEILGHKMNSLTTETYLKYIVNENN